MERMPDTDVLVEQVRDRLAQSRKLMDGCAETLPMASKPHYCVWSDRLSIALRDITTLVERLEAVERENERLRNTMYVCTYPSCGHEIEEL